MVSMKATDPEVTIVTVREDLPVSSANRLEYFFFEDTLNNRWFLFICIIAIKNGEGMYHE